MQRSKKRGASAMTSPEITWVLLGWPLDPYQDEWPATVFDLHSRRVRYQRITKSQALETSLMGGTAKWSARWCPQVGDKGEWSLIDMVPDTATEVAECGSR